jgi:TfoX/Sxy family transcriptional regulator of competence genes
MFGGYSMYSDGILFAIICDDKLFVKPTEWGRKFIKDVVEAPAFKGAKLSFLIGDKIEDREWISSLVKITREELPKPKPKKQSKKWKLITRRCRWRRIRERKWLVNASWLRLRNRHFIRIPGWLVAVNTQCRRVPTRPFLSSPAIKITCSPLRIGQQSDTSKTTVGLLGWE